MKIGDGSATVTEYEFPKATVRLAPLADGKVGTRVEVRSQDNGLAVLVRLCELTDASVNPCGNFSAKRRMRPAASNCFRADSLNAFILGFAGG